MKLIKSLDEYHSESHPCALTIGNFDGIHRGHQAVLERTKSFGLPTALITFENHPSTILRPKQPVQYLTSIEQRIKLIESANIDTLILLTFTSEFAEQRADEFLQKTRELIPFTHLILGHDATMGKDRHGDPEVIQSLGSNLGFEVEYLDEVNWNGETVSSSKIRELIQKGNFKKAEDLLGRPYSIYGQVIKGHGIGSGIGFQTANMNVDGLCLPPFGVYAVKVLVDDTWHFGIANLGVAPTVHKERTPTFEVHLFDYNKNLYNDWIEIIPLEFIRPEKEFVDLDSLKSQIAKDIQFV